MDFVIRRALPQDYAALCELFAELDEFHRTARPDIYRLPEGPARSEAYLAEQMADKEWVIFVAEEEGQGGIVLGFLNAQILQTRDIPILVPRRYARVDNLAVRQEARRLGIGTTLMAAAQAWARDQGAQHLELGVWEFNVGARALYESLGYETATRRMWLSLE